MRTAPLYGVKGLQFRVAEISNTEKLTYSEKKDRENKSICGEWKKYTEMILVGVSLLESIWF